MRISDWSSDVCSSDLSAHRQRMRPRHAARLDAQRIDRAFDDVHRLRRLHHTPLQRQPWRAVFRPLPLRLHAAIEIRVLALTNVVEGTVVSVRVYLGGRRTIKKKTQHLTKRQKR